jgi:anti-sigma B factor antagonist
VTSDKDTFPGRPLGIHVRPHGDAVIVEATGELDVVSAEKFQTALEHVLVSDASSVVLDLSKLDFIDSSGLRALLIISEQSSMDGTRLSIRRELSPSVERLLDLTGCAERLPMAD